MTALAFGPVPSRRLGRSLGINNIPPKSCSYACVYCQVGRTVELVAERRAFFPLRERREDIPLLVDHFVARLNRIQGKAIRGAHTEALGLFMGCDFPGNVRELENILEHAFVLCDGGRLELRHLPPHFLARRGQGAPSPAIREPTRAAEAGLITEALRRHGFDRLAAARALGIHKSTLFRKIRALGPSLPERDGRSGRRA